VTLKDKETGGSKTRVKPERIQRDQRALGGRGSTKGRQEDRETRERETEAARQSTAGEVIERLEDIRRERQFHRETGGY